MKKRSLTKLIIITLLALSFLAGCASGDGSQTNNEPGQKEELVFVNYRDIRDLNPHLYAGEMYAQEMLYETLVNITPDDMKAD